MIPRWNSVKLSYSKAGDVRAPARISTYRPLLANDAGQINSGARLQSDPAFLEACTSCSRRQIRCASRNERLADQLAPGGASLRHSKVMSSLLVSSRPALAYETASGLRAGQLVSRDEEFELAGSYPDFGTASTFVQDCNITSPTICFRSCDPAPNPRLQESDSVPYIEQL